MISIIIPVLNEESYLPGTLAAVQQNRSEYEIIVVDGGSCDASINVARRYGARVLSTAVKQRACQMNHGAHAARGDVLVFVHADTRLPKNALAQIESAIAKRHVVGGGFARRYDSTSWFLRSTCVLAGIRTRLIGWFLGDQAIFVRREVFERIGRFREFQIFEDLDFSRRMCRAGRVITLRPPVLTCSRRFTSLGPVATTWRDLLIIWSYLRGTDPNQLARKYHCIEKRPNHSERKQNVESVSIML